MCTVGHRHVSTSQCMTQRLMQRPQHMQTGHPHTQALTVVSIITVNFVVALIMEWLTGLEKHHTRTREGRYKMQAL